MLVELETVDEEGGTRDRLPPRRSGRAMSGLTVKQEAFALAVARGSNLSDAYRQAYDAERMQGQTVNKKASVLYGRDPIRARCDELRADFEARALREAARSEDRWLRDLWDLAEDASVSPAARVAALRELGKALRITTSDGDRVEDTQRDADTVAGEIMTKLETIARFQCLGEEGDAAAPAHPLIPVHAASGGVASV